MWTRRDGDGTVTLCWRIPAATLSGGGSTVSRKRPWQRLGDVPRPPRRHLASGVSGLRILLPRGWAGSRALLAASKRDGWACLILLLSLRHTDRDFPLLSIMRGGLGMLGESLGSDGGWVAELEMLEWGWLSGSGMEPLDTKHGMKRCKKTTERCFLDCTCFFS